MKTQRSRSFHIATNKTNRPSKEKNEIEKNHARRREKNLRFNVLSFPREPANSLCNKIIKAHLPRLAERGRAYVVACMHMYTRRKARKTKKRRERLRGVQEEERQGRVTRQGGSKVEVTAVDRDTRGRTRVCVEALFFVVRVCKDSGFHRSLRSISRGASSRCTVRMLGRLEIFNLPA